MPDPVSKSHPRGKIKHGNLMICPVLVEMNC